MKMTSVPVLADSRKLFGINSHPRHSSRGRTFKPVVVGSLCGMDSSFQFEDTSTIGGMIVFESNYRNIMLQNLWQSS